MAITLSCKHLSPIYRVIRITFKKKCHHHQSSSSPTSSFIKLYNGVCVCVVSLVMIEFEIWMDKNKTKKQNKNAKCKNENNLTGKIGEQLKNKVCGVKKMEENMVDWMEIEKKKNSYALIKSTFTIWNRKQSSHLMMITG